jgi:restriction system protein
VLGPWWVSACLAVVALVAFAILLQTENSSPVIVVLRLAAPFVICGLLFISGLSALRGWANRRMLDRQTGIDSLINLSWKDFEDLMAEAFRRQGYSVEETLGGGADGGIDLVLQRLDEKVLVQCKRWKDKAIPVGIVRETFGLLKDDAAASAAKIVTTSSFTPDARKFADGKPIELIDRVALLELLHDVQSPRAGNLSLAVVADAMALTPTCPNCNSAMVRRTARRGPNAGKNFWGCQNYPKCHESRAI